VKRLVVIPVRGGSKGIPGKNIKVLAGKPLLEYTLEAALEVAGPEDICVSTDDSRISEVAVKKGVSVPFLRPDHLATDTSSTYDVLLHALDFYETMGRKYQQIVLLQATSPFRTGRHIKEALSLYDETLEMVVSVMETSANPYYVLFEENKAGYLVKSKTGNFASRQECPKVWQYNGAIYIINVKALLQRSHLLFEKVKKYEMMPEDSLDIDTPLDWDFAEFMMLRKCRI
jgi:CMP-N,N'-diacetyllegionaminic acid synthase